MKISVILTTYNRAKKYLPKAIKSVLNQTFKDFELIIVDDGSTDNTTEVVRSFKDSRIKYFKIKHFGCDTYPKNIGTKRSNGEYVAYLDDDCAYRMDHLQVLFNVLERDKEKKFQVVYGDRWVHYDNPKDGKDQIGIYNNFDYSYLMKRNFIDTSDVLIRKEALFEVGGWDEGIKKFIDWNLWVRMAKRGFRFKRVPIIITDYTIYRQMKSVLNTEGKLDPTTGLFIPTFDPYNCKINVGFIGKKKPLKVAIFTLTKDRLEFTKKTFESLRRTAGYEFDHYVVDQGSKDGTVKYLEENDFRKVIFNDKNMGIPYASNQAIEEIKKGNYDLVCKVDNDVLFKTNGWLKAMVKIYETFRHIALSPYPEGLIQNAGGVFRDSYLYMAGEFLGLVMHIGGMVSCVPIEVYDKFKWPRVAFLHGGNDVLLSSWLNRNDYILAYLENHRAEHMESGGKNKYPEYFKQRDRETKTRTIEYLETGKYREKSRSFKVAMNKE